MKKAIAFALVLALLISLSACGIGGNNVINTNTDNDSNTVVPADVDTIAGTYKITVWCPADAVYLIIKQIADFNASNGHGIIIEASVVEKTAEEAGESFPADLAEAPDLFIFSQTQLDALVKHGAIDALGEAASKYIKDSSDAAAVAAAGIGDSLYAYPLTSDSGYIMYYNKKIIPESDIDSLEKLLSDCAAAGKNFSMTAGTGKGLVSFFFAAGCVSGWETDENGSFTGVNDTFDSSAGLAAARALYMLEKSACYKASDNPTALASQSAVVISDIGAFRAAQEALGDDLGVADLPSFSVNGAWSHMSSFSGCRLLGVKHQDDAKAADVISQLAQFLADYDRQMERAGAIGWYPADLKAQGTDTVRSDAAFAALAQQKSYAVLEGSIHSGWWTAAQQLAADIAGSDGSDAGLQKALNSYRDQLYRILGVDVPEKND